MRAHLNKNGCHMSEFLTPEALSALLQVIFIDLVLAGDNAIVIGLAAAGLPKDQRNKAILIGIVAATVLRIGFAAITTQLLQIVGLLLVGGILLLWVCWKMWRELRTSQEDEREAAESLASDPVPAKAKAGGAPKPRKTLGQAALQIVIADEINRASPKTQSALLEAMEERQVTVDGTSHRLADPFLVVATQNPLEMEGTYALPEAQRDRFMMRISMGYPDAASEALMLRQRETVNPLDGVAPVLGAADVRALIVWARGVHVSPAVEEYTVGLARATREHPDLRLGASPRATLQLVRAAKVRAALDGREFVIPDDVAALV